MKTIFKFINIFFLIKSIVILLNIFFLNNIINKTEFLKSENTKPIDSLFNEKDKCLNYKSFQCMICKNGYQLNNGKCVINHSFKAIYYSSHKNENIQLISDIYEKFIEELIIDNELKTPSTHYISLEPGLHKIMISLNVNKLNSTAKMFYGMSNMIDLKITKNFGNENLESMKEMFKDCKNLKTVVFENHNYKYITDLSHMFENCISLTSLKLPFFVSKKLENISYMFSNCTSLKSIDIQNINTINIKDLSGLFYGCSSLESLNLSAFNTKNAIYIEYMFSGCSSLKSLDLENFNMNKIENLNFMFANCSHLNSIKLPYLNEIQVTNINNMFIGCNSLSSKNIFFSKSGIINNINDICIIGLWYGSNYGSMLTYYALHQVIKKMNYSILMINNPLEPDNIIYNKFHPKSMTNSLYKVSKKKKLDQLSEFNKECRLFLVGSDQLWNIHLSRSTKQFYFLGFADNYNKKLSYGTSFGRKYDGNEEEKKITKANLERFDAISVRDELSLNISKEIFGLKNVAQVCDPTLLCDFSDYINGCV